MDVVKAQGKKAVAVSVMSLSNRMFTEPIEPHEDRIHSLKDDEWNQKILEFLSEGRLEDVGQLSRTIQQQIRVQKVVNFKPMWWLSAMNDNRNNLTGKVLAYEGIHGAGCAVVNLNPTPSGFGDKEYDEDDFKYFRTLHSLAFRRLGIKKENVMQKSHYEDLGKKLGIKLDYHDYDNNESGLFTTNSDLLRIVQLAKLRGITPEQQYNLKEHTQDITTYQLKQFVHDLNQYKKDYNLIDFTDMITEFIKSDKSPKFDVVFIDEAQDLSQTQWTMAKSIWDKTNDTYIAGDDDQAIFRWAGADVDSFIAQTGKIMQLTHCLLYTSPSPRDS